MLFELKKFITFWLMPVPFCLALLVVGWGLAGLSRRRGLGRGLAALGTALLLLFSNRTVSNGLIRPLEDRYRPVPELRAGEPLPPGLAACRYVVVLGGGNANGVDWPAAIKLSPSGAARLTEALRLLRALPQAELVVSGGGPPGRPSHARILEEAAESLGVPADRIRRLDRPRDTEDESQAVQRLVGPAPFALVTSAWHLPRAAALFEARGLHFLPCPTDFLGRPVEASDWLDEGWGIDSLERSTAAVHEYLGLFWLRLKRGFK